MRIMVCTIISRNYLPCARALYESLQEQNEGCDFCVLMVDGVDDRDRREEFEIINVRDLELNYPLQCLAFRYNKLELNTNVKPTFLKLLLDRGFDKVLYLDPDILICGPIDPLFELLDQYDILLTPHCTSAVEDDGKRPSEIDFLLTGIFNLGFIGLRRAEETQRFLGWWEKRCLAMGYSELRSGLFVDQKWVNLVPCYFNSVHVVRDPGYNMAYWNLHERKLTETESGYLVNGEYPLRFFHFSGIDLEDYSQLSKHCNRFSLEGRPDLIRLFRNYRDRVEAKGGKECRNIPYAYGSFSNGDPITQIARSAFALSESSFSNDDPFSTASGFYRWARSRRVLGNTDSSGKYNLASYKNSGRKVRIANGLLSGLLRVVGPNRYTILMKYLSFISILRNQPGVLSPEGQFRGFGAGQN
jgi:hypothetical protein